ncbi:hypothetical protein HK101_005518 [Irineochytrium annulatum]|nr:hypothetical protein HK101_005518 [Irineochytrium annulatum]
MFRCETGHIEGRQLLGGSQGISDQKQVQRLSSAYQTLSDAQTRQAYDLQIFGSMREFVLWSGGCWGAAKFEILKLYEIQHDLQSLPYLDVIGRWRMSGQLSNGMIVLMCKMMSVKSVASQ